MRIHDIPFKTLDALQNTLQQLKKAHPKSLHVRIDINAEHYMTRDITVAADLSDAEIMQFLQSRAVALLGHPADQLRIDYQKHALVNDTQTITIVAAHAAFIQHIETCCRTQKITLATIRANQMNLVDWREETRKKIRKKWIAIMIFCMATIGMVCLLIKSFLLHEIAQLQSDTRKMHAQQLHSALPHPHRTVALLQKIKTIYPKKIVAITFNRNIEKQLAMIATDLPSTLTLTTLTLNTHHIQITGMSNQLSDIHAYAAALKQSMTQQKIELSEIHTNPQHHADMLFTIQVSA